MTRANRETNNTSSCSTLPNPLFSFILKSPPEVKSPEPEVLPEVTALSDAVYNEGEKLSLEIEIKSESKFEVTWLCKESESETPSQFMSDEDNFTIIETTMTHSKLILDDVTEDDSGKYIVRVKNQAGEVEKDCNVIVRKSNPLPEFILLPDEVDCIHNEECTIIAQTKNANSGK